MPSERYTRIEITPEAYMGLEAEAILQGKTLKRLASELIMRGISEKALRFINADAICDEDAMDMDQVPPCQDIEDQDIIPQPRFRRPKISENDQARELVKEMWVHNPRPSQREIARKIGYPSSSTKYLIKKMLESGELEP
ncbi:MAG TPA: winged helix-turn-helix domain-containing protein [Methanotrichaceae archaeon]|nr:winged helix-turn-helix domain-containing protein [Methanotrichaceae archaeon]